MCTYVSHIIQKSKTQYKTLQNMHHIGRKKMYTNGVYRHTTSIPCKLAQLNCLTLIYRRYKVS